MQSSNCYCCLANQGKVMNEPSMREVVIIQGVHQAAKITEEANRTVPFTDTSIKRFHPLVHLSEFEDKFPDQMTLFGLIGMHPRENKPLINPYTQEPVTESFTNIGEHCISVAYCASRIASVMHETGLISNRDRNWICERALVHDLNKPFEIMRKWASKAGLADDVYSVSAYEKLRPLLIEAGVSEALTEYLVRAGSETGHNSLKDFIIIGPDGYQGLVAGKVAEKIVHLADDMTFTNNPKEGQASITCFLTPWERMLASQFIEKYPFLWEEGLALDGEGSIVAVSNVNSLQEGQRLIGNYAQLQVQVANSIARELQLFIDPSSQERPENFVRRIVNENL